MPIIQTKLEKNKPLILTLRIISGLIWGGTVLRRLVLPNFGNFEQRITQMAQGSALYPPLIMDWAVTNWFLIFLTVLLLEIISSLSLLTGTFSRLGALLATINGFAIGLAGIGLGLFDLLIPWTVAIITLVLFIFTHPGMYYGADERLVKRNLPSFIKLLM